MSGLTDIERAEHEATFQRSRDLLAAHEAMRDRLAAAESLLRDQYASYISSVKGEAYGLEVSYYKCDACGGETVPEQDPMTCEHNGASEPDPDGCPAGLIRDFLEGKAAS